MEDRQFKILKPFGADSSYAHIPSFVPWLIWSYDGNSKISDELFDERDKLVKINLGASLEDLHNRGGLDPVEFYLLWHGIDWHSTRTKQGVRDSISWLNRTVKKLEEYFSKKEEVPKIVQREILKYFSYQHLPLHLQSISQPFHKLAHDMETLLPQCDEKDKFFDELLKAKDCAVRAGIDLKPKT